MSIYLVLESHFDKLNFPVYRLEFASHLKRNINTDEFVFLLRFRPDSVHEVFTYIKSQFEKNFENHREFGMSYYSGDVNIMCDIMYASATQFRSSSNFSPNTIKWYTRL